MLQPRSETRFAEQRVDFSLVSLLIALFALFLAPSSHGSFTVKRLNISACIYVGTNYLIDRQEWVY